MITPVPARASGSHFYKYSSAQNMDRLKPVLLEHRLYLPTLDQLNDPVDGRPKLAVLEPEAMVSFLIAAMVKDKPTMSDADRKRHTMILQHNLRLHGMEFFHSEMTRLLHRDLESFRVYSMSKRWDNLALWAKYAGDHTGYCLEFTNEGPLFEHAKEVIYAEAFPMDVTNAEHRSGYWFFMKTPEWSNEEEVRLVRPRTPNNVPGVIIQPEWLRRIILGRHMTEDNRRQICAWSAARNPTLAVAQARYDRVAQRLELEPVSCPELGSTSPVRKRAILDFSTLRSLWAPYDHLTAPPQEPISLWGEGGVGIWISNEWGPPVPYPAVNRHDGGVNHGYRRIKGNLAGLAQIPEVEGWPELRRFLEIINGESSPIESVGCEKGFFPGDIEGGPPVKLGSYVDVIFSEPALNDEPENPLLLASTFVNAIAGCEKWWAGTSFVLQRNKGLLGSSCPWGLMLQIKNYGQTEEQARQLWGRTLSKLGETIASLPRDFRVGT